MGSSAFLILMIVLLGGMFLLNSRQRKKQQAQYEQLQSSVGVGDVVVMTSGISGTVVDIDDEKTVDLEIAPDVITTWLRAAIREKLSPDAPGADHDGTGHDIEHEHAPELDGAPHAGSTDHTVAAPGAATSTAPSHPESHSESHSETTSTTAAAPIAAPGRNGSEPSDEVSGPRSS